MGGVNKQRTWSSRAWPCPPERPSAAAFPGTPMGPLLCSLWCGFNHQFVVFPFVLHQLGAEQQRPVPCPLAAALDPLRQRWWRRREQLAGRAIISCLHGLPPTGVPGRTPKEEGFLGCSPERRGKRRFDIWISAWTILAFSGRHVS